MTFSDRGITNLFPYPRPVHWWPSRPSHLISLWPPWHCPLGYVALSHKVPFWNNVSIFIFHFVYFIFLNTFKSMSNTQKNIIIAPLYSLNSKMTKQNNQTANPKKKGRGCIFSFQSPLANTYNNILCQQLWQVKNEWPSCTSIFNQCKCIIW